MGDFGAEGRVASAGGDGSRSEAGVSGPGDRDHGCDGAVLSTRGLHQVRSVRLNVQGVCGEDWRYLKSMIPTSSDVLKSIDMGGARAHTSSFDATG